MNPPERHAAVLEALNQQITDDPFLPVPFRRVLEGCRRILQRHAPVLCRHCPESRQHYVSAARPMVTWPDEDWLDASTGVEDR